MRALHVQQNDPFSVNCVLPSHNNPWVLLLSHLQSTETIKFTEALLSVYNVSVIGQTPSSWWLPVPQHHWSAG